MPDDATCLDPAFWQAIGSSLQRRQPEACHACGQGEDKCPWHRFVDHLTAGKDPQTFFDPV